MRRVKRWRYYCEFCKKSGASGGHMKKHEERCTKNPKRVCGMCAMMDGDWTQRPIGELVEAIGDGSAAGLARLQDISDGCPACMLAGIVQSNIGSEWNDSWRDEWGAINEPRPAALEWEFKPARDSFMAEFKDNQDY